MRHFNFKWRDPAPTDEEILEQVEMLQKVKRGLIHCDFDCDGNCDGDTEVGTSEISTEEVIDLVKGSQEKDSAAPDTEIQA